MTSFDLGAVPRPAVAVDIVVLTLRAARLHVLLIERGAQPFLGQWALPGGFLHVGEGDQGGESLDEAAVRELAEETGLAADSVMLEQFAVFGAPGRDPRGRTITVAFFALVRPELAGFVKGGTDAAAAAFVAVDDATGLAFDHDLILRAALERLRDDVKGGAPVAFALAPEPFTIRELQDVHEALLQQRFGDGPFRKRFDRLLEEKKVERVEGKRVTTRRPAMVFRATQRAPR
ncbi:MAG: NUDIX domain-containing protein [Deltaproteobacteria bacterium]|nr:NUDIX domain-containing protein [Deltaproteobacteria bacterium]